MGIKAKRKQWYTKRVVKYCLVESIKNREVIIIDRKDSSHVVRGIFIKTVDYLDYYFKRFNFFEENYNMYISCSSYNHIPMFTFNLKLRSAETCWRFANEAIGKF